MFVGLYMSVPVTVQMRGDRNAELLETSRSNCTFMKTVNELDGLRAQLPEPQTVD